jgi:hypothetical protein
MGGICEDYPDCCGGEENWWFADETINQTYAATHWYCYPDGHPPGWSNSSNFTNMSGISTTRDKFNISFDDLDKNKARYDAELAEKKRLFVDIPIMLSQISGAFSIFTCTAVIAIFIAILVYQPIMYVF